MYWGILYSLVSLLTGNEYRSLLLILVLATRGIGSISSSIVIAGSLLDSID